MQTLNIGEILIYWWLIMGLVQYGKIVNRMARDTDFVDFALNSFLLLLFLPAMPLLWVMSATLATAIEVHMDETEQ